MKEIRYIETRTNIAGLPKGEKLGEDIYNLVMQSGEEDIENIKIILDFSKTYIVAMSIPEGFKYFLGKQKNGSVILENIEVIGDERIIHRFAKYVGKKKTKW